MRPALLLLFLSFASLVRADLLPEALQIFPADTISLEYDNLSALRQLPNYSNLRQQYTSEPIKRVKSTFLALGISEDQLSEVVTASGPGGFFGIVTGNFSPTAARRKAAQQGLSRTTLGNGSAFCSQENVCVFFPMGQNGNASFATLEQLRAMLNVRNGHAPAVASSPSFRDVLAGMDLHAPVVGLAPGSEIKELMKEVIPPELASRYDFSQWFSSIESLGYSIRMDTSAHLSAHLLCKSETASRLLTNTLNAASSFQRMAAMAVGDSMLFRNLSAVSTGRIVALKLDARLGS